MLMRVLLTIFMIERGSLGQMLVIMLKLTQRKGALPLVRTILFQKEVQAVVR